MQRKLTISVLLLSVIFFFIFQILKFSYSPDDTYIYLKYSKNIANGNGFSFNTGEPSYGVTSFIWAVFLSTPFLFGTDGFWFAKFADLLVFISAAFVFYRLVSFFFSDFNIRLISVSLFLINPWVIRSVFTGMETSLAILIILIVFQFFYQRKYYLGFFFSGLSLFIRPETAVIVPVLILTLIFDNSLELNRKLRIIVLCVIVFLMTVTPFLVYSNLTFGTFLPNTVSGKASLNFVPSDIFPDVKRIFTVFALIQPFEIFFALLGLILIIKEKDFRYIPLILWIGGLLLLYLIASAAVMARYFMIVYPFVLVIAMRFFEQLTIRNYYYSLILIIIMFVYSSFIFFRYVKPYSDNFTAGVEQCLIPLGKWIENNTPAGSRILVNDVGAIGYNTSRYIIDAAALINRDLELNKKILSLSVYQKENPHLMLDFIETDYLVEKKSLPVPVTETKNYRLELLEKWVFPQMWVFDPNPQYFFLYKVQKKVR
ncbi:MAG: hypothetical protein N2510_00235 [Ignavibacteria bacterium]|nr:hypothetical protein [Ignavibacteria bacterium]